MPRRDFLGMTGLWATGVAILGSLIGMVRLAKPAVLPEAARRFRIGRPGEFPVGTSRIIAEQNVMIVSQESGIAALSLVCTHLGCIVSKTREGFSCPCHGSTFDENGHVRGGPAPRGLRWFKVARTVDGRLLVDAGDEVDPGTYFVV